MTIQFAGSSSTGNRRRRRLVANGDGVGVDSSLLEGDGAEIESQLVASAAAGPWVPVNERRIWIYAALIGVLLGALTFALSRPDMIHSRLTPLTEHLFEGPRPVLIIYTEVAFLALSAQLGMLIGWYRAQCKLDFGGRHRVWPWAVGLFGLAAFYLATDAHRTFGQVVQIDNHLSWRGDTVVWLLPLCLVVLPISLFLDRDMRNSPSSLWTLRLSGILWLTEAWFELYQPELQSKPWFQLAFLVIPLYASATLFLGLWLHARIVAYVCPDPPDLDERSAWSRILGVCGWIGRSLLIWRRRGTDDEEDEAKPKRRRKKADGEEATTRRKRKAPAKKPASRTRTRKPVEEEEEVAEESSGEESEVEDETESSPASKSSWNDNQDQEDEESVETQPEKSAATQSKGNSRITQMHKSHGQSTPAPHSRRQSSSWEEESEAEEESRSSQGNDSSDDGDDEGQLDSGLTADQMKGLSKRQKRELRKQQREQERSRGR